MSAFMKHGKNKNIAGLLININKLECIIYLVRVCTCQVKCNNKVLLCYYTLTYDYVPNETQNINE